eukprot:COSAG01_NODE_1969_length_8767_cov_72.274689_5_plen_306_part_00
MSARQPLTTKVRPRKASVAKATLWCWAVVAAADVALAAAAAAAHWSDARWIASSSWEDILSSSSPAGSWLQDSIVPWPWILLPPPPPRPSPVCDRGSSGGEVAIEIRCRCNCSALVSPAAAKPGACGSRELGTPAATTAVLCSLLLLSPSDASCSALLSLVPAPGCTQLVSSSSTLSAPSSSSSSSHSRQLSQTAEVAIARRRVVAGGRSEASAGESPPRRRQHQCSCADACHPPNHCLRLNCRYPPGDGAADVAGRARVDPASAGHCPLLPAAAKQPAPAARPASQPPPLQYSNPSDLSPAYRT